MSETQKLRLIPLGGIGDVTKNMYAYELGNEILVVDCGVGFPDEGMLGIDFVIPDTTYLKAKKQNVLGIVLTHGHDDHIGALPYIIPELNVPIYATRLTAALAEVKLKETNIQYKMNVVDPESTLKLGAFDISFIHVTHSIPDANNLLIKTPAGNFYHGSDFKFDWTPLDGKCTEVGKIAKAGQEGILCLLSDCLRSEKPGYTLSETVIEDTLEHEIRNCNGKFIVTTQSSNISRLQLAVNVALSHGRKICFIGRSMEQNIEVALKLGYIKFPDSEVVRVEELPRNQSNKLALMIAGSQGQAGSSLSKIANKQNKFVSIGESDVVVFSADPIPGNENAVHSLIDTLTKNGAKVSYSEVMDDLHVSGHAAANEIMLMIGLTSPRYLLPIGGTIRQMERFSELAQKMRYGVGQIILSENGQVIEFENGKITMGERIEAKNILVDGLGVGDVGNVVLRDRKLMAGDGIAVVVVPVEQATGQVVGDVDIISRGFVYVKESEELIAEAKQVVRKCLSDNKGSVTDWHFLRRHIEETLEEFFYKQTRRRPMILPVVVEV